MRRQRFSIFTMFYEPGVIAINEICGKIVDFPFCWFGNQVVDLAKLDELVNLSIYLR